MTEATESAAKVDFEASQNPDAATTPQGGRKVRARSKPQIPNI